VRALGSGPEDAAKRGRSSGDLGKAVERRGSKANPTMSPLDRIVQPIEKGGDADGLWIMGILPESWYIGSHSEVIKRAMGRRGSASRRQRFPPV